MENELSKTRIERLKMLKALEELGKKEEYLERRELFRGRDLKEKQHLSKRRNFIRELKQGGVSLAKISRETGISYYKIRQIKLGKKKLRSDTPQYRKIKNLYRRIGYQKLRVKGLSPKEAQKLRGDVLKNIIKKTEKAKEKGFILDAILLLRDKITGEVFTDTARSYKIEYLDINRLRDDIIKIIKGKYDYNVEIITFIKETITETI